MAQKSENFKFEGKYAEYIPVASTQISSGDAVSLVNGRLQPAAALKADYKNLVGFCDDNWNATVAIQRYGAASTDYATPTTRPVKLKVYHDGVFDLAIREAAGTAGQAVYLLTATTGSQVFTVEPITVSAETVMGPVGFLYETFAGATPNDCQKVRVTAGLQNNPRDIRWSLMNRVLLWGAGPTTNCVRLIGQSAPGDSYAFSIGRFAALVNGVFVTISSDCTVGTMQLTDSVEHNMIVMWGIGSGGSVCIFYDTAKRTASGTVASATMRADPYYWPSMTTDYLPFAMGFVRSDSAVSGPIYVVFPTVADCLRVT